MVWYRSKPSPRNMQTFRRFQQKLYPGCKVVSHGCQNYRRIWGCCQFVSTASNFQKATETAKDFSLGGCRIVLNESLQGEYSVVVARLSGLPTDTYLADNWLLVLGFLPQPLRRLASALPYQLDHVFGRLWTLAFAVRQQPRRPKRKRLRVPIRKPCVRGQLAFKIKPLLVCHLSLSACNPDCRNIQGCLALQYRQGHIVPCLIEKVRIRMQRPQQFIWTTLNWVKLRRVA